MHLYNFLVCGPKFTRFILANVGGVAVDHLRFRFLVSRPIPETFAIKVESCQKSCRNLEVFWPSQILESGTSKSYTHFITPASRHVGWKKFCEDTSISAEVIGAQTLNFKPNFKFSRIIFLGWASSQLWCALASLGQSVSLVKIWGAAPPKGRNIVSRKMSAWVGQYEPLSLLFVDQSSPSFCYPTWKGL